MATATTATIRAAPSTVAAPESSLAGFDRGDGFGGDEHAGQQRRPATDPGHDEPAVTVERHRRTRRRHPIGGSLRRVGVSPCGQARSLAGGVDAAHPHRHGRDSGEAEHDHRHQRSNGQRGFDGAEAAVTDQTLVLSARLMMLVSAPTIESPVTTL